ncbi:GNAT family N-acetyltransferase [Marinomonas algicola]|uniref:GNAT family N-acetyltransferase n=1 Tax=Marinomonas algicola TaxID=2773454 RepID=UPI00174A9660|nr:GNAT family N-acetyltransferase [Marinomonas algicola]
MDFNSLNCMDIETAGFKSWPALEERKSNAVVLRFSNGYTKRANSVSVLSEQTGDLSMLVKRYEAFFEGKGLPCIFRLPSFTNNQALDAYLGCQGYQLIDRSLVLYKSLEGTTFNDSNIVEKRRDEWMLSYCQINGLDIAKQATHLDILNRIKDRVIMAVLMEGEEEIACGLGVISHGYFGLFDFVTKPSVRKMGYGTTLLNGMLYWAVENGAKNAYLQVVSENQAALNLYQKLGYKPCYEYWYRIRDKVNTLSE